MQVIEHHRSKQATDEGGVYLLSNPCDDGMFRDNEMKSQEEQIHHRSKIDYTLDYIHSTHIL